LTDRLPAPSKPQMAQITQIRRRDRLTKPGDGEADGEEKEG
jgi:hypothetical protein